MRSERIVKPPLFEPRAADHQQDVETAPVERHEDLVLHALRLVDDDQERGVRRGVMAFCSRRFIRGKRDEQSAFRRSDRAAQKIPGRNFVRCRARLGMICESNCFASAVVRTTFPLGYLRNQFKIEIATHTELLPLPFGAERQTRIRSYSAPFSMTRTSSCCQK